MVARLTSIVAIDRNGAIGCQNELPWKLKNDMAFFRRMTIGNTVVMGRKTFDSIGSALPKRKNIVLSRNGLLFDSTSDLRLALSVEEALAVASVLRSREVFVVGGAATYQEFAPLVDRYLVTVVDCETPGADAFLSPEIRQELCSWESEELDEVHSSPEDDQFPFRVFEYNAPDEADRRDIRQEIIAKHLIKKAKSASTKRPSDNFGLQVAQQAFAF